MVEIIIKFNFVSNVIKYLIYYLNYFSGEQTEHYHFRCGLPGALFHLHRRSQSAFGTEAGGIGLLDEICERLLGTK